MFPLDLAARQATAVRLELANVWETGESVAPLLFNGEQIGNVRVFYGRVPFAVTLDVQDQQTPALDFEAGRPTEFILHNEDGMTYPLTWELIVEGTSVVGRPVTLWPDDTATRIGRSTRRVVSSVRQQLAQTARGPWLSDSPTRGPELRRCSTAHEYDSAHG